MSFSIGWIFLILGILGAIAFAIMIPILTNKWKKDREQLLIRLKNDNSVY